jgi:hypothetical protein
VSQKDELMKHYLKTWPDPFEEVWKGDKPFEIRKDDRGFKLGDWLTLQEWNPKTERYTGRMVEVLVTSLYRGPSWGLPKNLIIMGWRHRLCRQSLDRINQ